MAEPRNSKGKNMNWRGGSVSKQVKGGMERNLDTAAIFVQGDIIGHFKQGNAGGTKNPSKPGDIPAVVTGRLKASIGWRKSGKMQRRVGSGIGAGKQDPGYAILLEFGTRASPGRFITEIKARVKGGRHPGMAARPWLRPAIARTKRPVGRILKKRVV